MSAGLTAALTIAVSAEAVLKFVPPNAYMPAMIGVAGSPIITPVSPLGTLQRGIVPPSCASWTSDCAISPARAGSIMAMNWHSLRYMSQPEKNSYLVYPDVACV